MKEDLLEKIVETVLYEGYILYPYRASSPKNRRPFTLGRVYPQVYHVAQAGAEAHTMQAECLVRMTGASLGINGSVRFLQPTQRLVGQPTEEIQDWPPESPPHLEFVSQLDVDGQIYPAWQECVERRVTFEGEPQAASAREIPFSFSESLGNEVLCDRHGHIAGLIVRRQEALEGLIQVILSECDTDVARLTVRVSNTSTVPRPSLDNEEEVLMRTFASAHIVLHVSGGEFLSLTDPPHDCRQASQACKNSGCWPVLVGDEARHDRDTLLAAPIALRDYPRLAAESAETHDDGREVWLAPSRAGRIMSFSENPPREFDRDLPNWWAS